MPAVSAKIRSFHVGVVPRWIDAVSASMFSADTMPTTMISSCTARSAVTSTAIRFHRVTEKPVMLRTAT